MYNVIWNLKINGTSAQTHCWPDIFTMQSGAFTPFHFFTLFSCNFMLKKNNKKSTTFTISNKNGLVGSEPLVFRSLHRCLIRSWLVHRFPKGCEEVCTTPPQQEAATFRHHCRDGVGQLMVLLPGFLHA